MFFLQMFLAMVSADLVKRWVGPHFRDRAYARERSQVEAELRIKITAPDGFIFCDRPLVHFEELGQQQFPTGAIVEIYRPKKVK